MLTFGVADMTTPSTEQLIPLLQATLSPNADHRKQAEQQLQLVGLQISIKQTFRN